MQFFFTKPDWSKCRMKVISVTAKKICRLHASLVTNLRPGLEVIKLEYSLRLKIKRNDWLLVDTCVRKQPIIARYFESENELKFYNLEARWRSNPGLQIRVH